MLNCPFCGFDLTQARLDSERCPSCSALLIWDDETDDSSASDRRSQDDLPHSPVVVDRNLSLKEILSTFVGRGAVGTSREPAQESPPSLLGTDPTPAAASNDVPAKDESAIRDEPAGTPPSPAVPESSTPSPSAHSPPQKHLQTIDPRVLSPEQADMLSAVWEPVIPAQTTSRSTLKAESQRTAISRALVIPPRSLQQSSSPLESPDYRLLNWIGEGGVGIVHTARQVSVNRTVAVKMLRPEIAEDPDHRNKFLIEAIVTADLDHPNIVPIHELGADQSNALFYSMKRVQGTPWSDEISKKSTAENIDILMKVADAIAFAHSRGVVHRDLKPENIMLGDFGEVLVMDWGIALSTSEYLKTDGITQSSSMGGTPAYMAPEMATGPLGAIGTPCDVYLLGAVLFEITTRQPPHTGVDVMDCLRAAARNEIVPTRESGELLEIAYRAMSTQPQDRYASVQEFQAAIRQYEAHSESIALSHSAAETLTEARRTQDFQDFARALFAYQEALAIWEDNLAAKMGMKEAKFAYAEAGYQKGDFDVALSLLDAQDPEQAPLFKKVTQAKEERSARQHRLKTARRTVRALVAVVLVVVTGGLFAVLGLYQRAITEADNARTAENSARAAEDSARAAEDIANKKSVEALDQKAIADKARQNSEDAERRAILAKRDAEYASYVAEIGLAAERIGNNAFQDAMRLLEDYSEPDRAAYRNWEWGHLEYLCRLAFRTLEQEAHIEDVACSGDGRWLVAGTSNGHVRIWDRQSGEMLEPLPNATPVEAVAVTHDGRFVLSGGEEVGEIQVWERSQDGRSYRRQAPLVGHRSNSSILSLRLSADETRLLSGSADGTARLWDWRERSELHAFRGHSGPVHAAALHPGGSHVVTASEDGTVRVWPVPRAALGPAEPSDEPNTEGRRIRFTGHRGAVFAADFAAGGRWVASAGRDGKILIWDWDKAARALPQNTSKDDLSEEMILTWNGDQVQVFRFKGLETALQSRSSDATPDQLVIDIGLRVLAGHEAEVRSLDFADRFDGRQGDFLVSGGHDNTVKVWDLQASDDSANQVLTFRGHGGWVRSAIFLPEDSLIASGSFDRQVKIWDAKKYEEVRVLRGQPSAIADASLSADGRRAITAGRDGIARVWDLDSGRRLLELQDTGQGVVSDDQREVFVAKLDEGHEFLVSGAIFFPQPDPRLLTSAGDGTVRLWNHITGGQLCSFEHTGPNALLTLADDGRWLLTGGRGNEAFLWDVENSQEPLAILRGHRHEVTALAISHDGDLEQRMLLTGDASGVCKLWQWNAQSQNWDCFRELAGHLHGQPITGASFLPDNRHLLTASQDYTVMRWELPTGKLLMDRTLKHPGGVRAMNVTSDGQRAVTVCYDAAASGGQPTAANQYRLSLWDLSNTRLLGSQVVAGGMITSIALSRDDQSVLVVAATSGTGGRVYRWEFDSNQYQPLWSDQIHRGAVWAAAESRDPGYVVTVGGSHARLWQEGEGQLAQSYSRHGPLNASAFSPSGALAVTADGDGAVKIWNVAEPNPDGRVIWKIPAAHGKAASPYAVNSAVFGPRSADGDGYLLTAGDDGTARLWRLGDGPPKPLSTLSGHTAAVQHAAFSADGDRIATASSDGTVRIWNAADPENVTLDQVIGAETTPAWGVTGVDFSPDGKRLVGSMEDTTARIWDLEDENNSILLEGHTASLTSVAFSPDGKRVVSGSNDGMAKVWDARSGSPVLSLNRHAAEVTAVEFSSLGDRILTASNDETAIVWLATPFGEVQQDKPLEQVSRE